MTRDELLDLGHRNMAAYYRESALWSRGGAALEEGGVLCYASSTRFPAMMNGVVRTDARTSAAEVIERAREFFSARRRGFTLWTRSRTDDDLAAAAEAFGLSSIVDTPEMVVVAPLAKQPEPPGVEIRRIRSIPDVVAFSEMNGEAYSIYGMPPAIVREAFDAPERFLAPHVHGVIAWVDGVAAAGALTLLSHRIAGVYWVGTRSDFRGRGLGEAVTRTVTNAAFELGAAANTLQASVMGDPIYRRMGFEEVYRYRGYLSLRAKTNG